MTVNLRKELAAANARIVEVERERDEARQKMRDTMRVWFEDGAKQDIRIAELERAREQEQAILSVAFDRNDALTAKNAALVAALTEAVSFESVRECADANCTCWLAKARALLAQHREPSSDPR